MAVVNVAYQVPITFVPQGSRKPRTEMFARSIEVDVPEVLSPDNAEAINVKLNFPDVPQRRFWWVPEEVAHAHRDEIRRVGHGGRLWADCAREAHHNFIEISNARIADGVDLAGAIGTNFAERYWPQSPDALPERGFLARMPGNPREVLSINLEGRARNPAGKTDGPRGPCRIITSLDDDRQARARRFVEENLMVVGGKLHIATNPPAFAGRRAWRNGISTTQREASPGPALVHFRADDEEAFIAYMKRYGKAEDSFQDHFFAHLPGEMTPAYLDIDRVDLAIESLKMALPSFSKGFSDLPDDSIDRWIELRHAVATWKDAKGDPAAIVAAVDAFHSSVPREIKSVARSSNMQFDAFLRLMKTFDLSNRPVLEASSPTL
mgnify:CR=1 FL=1